MRTLEEVTMYLINASDALELARKKLDNNNLAFGQESLVKAINYFKEAKKEIEKKRTTRSN